MKSKATDRNINAGHHHSLTAVGRQQDRFMLIEWLNAAAGSKSYQRVSGLLHNILSATGLFGGIVQEALRDLEDWHTKIPGETRKIQREKRRHRPEVEKLLGTIKATVKDYVFHPRLTLQSQVGQRWWFDLVGESVPGDYKLTLDGGRRVYEADAVFGILRLASYGFLERVKQCLACQKWLYAHPSHKKFCDVACQLKHFAVSPRQLEKRAEYMRDYRRREQLKRERELRLARKPHRQ